MSNTLKLGNGKWATGKDTVLAFNDENNNFKPLPFSFSRASSGTVINKDGLIETVGSGEPRIDFKDNTKGALKLEPTRSNLVTKSENIQDWNRASNATAEYGSKDPFKGNKAVKLTSSSDAQAYQVYQSTGSLSLGNEYTFSMYAKKGTGYIFRLDFGIPDNGFVNIDLRDGSVLQESGSTYYSGYKVEPVSDGWYRISMTATLNSSAYYRAGLYGQQGDCYVAFSQIEQGSYATSYIPTSGSAVTRVAESSSQTVPDGVIGQTEGTVFIDVKPFDNIDGLRYISFENSSSISNGWFGVFSGLNSGLVRFRFFGDGWNIYSPFAIEKGLRYKVAFSYKNGIATSIYINGTFVNNITASLSGKSYQKIRLSEAAIGNRGDADFNDIKLYDTIKTDQELIALTTI